MLFFIQVENRGIMIEVEKKFFLNEQHLQNIANVATKIKQHHFTDVYYDTKDFQLTLKDRWLRARDGVFQLKEPLHESADRLADQYREIEEESEIRERLNLPLQGTMQEALEAHGYLPFCTCTTQRTKYKKDDFVIDIDAVSAEHFTYHLAEVELLVESSSQIEKALENILAFAKSHQFTCEHVRGKVIEYLRQRKPDHFLKLLHAKVIK